MPIMAATCRGHPNNVSWKCGSEPASWGLSLEKQMLNEDYRDMLQCLVEENVRFLLVGAYAVAVYGYPRATKDIDLFVNGAMTMHVI